MCTFWQKIVLWSWRPLLRTKLFFFVLHSTNFSVKYGCIFGYRSHVITFVTFICLRWCFWFKVKLSCHFVRFSLQHPDCQHIFWKKRSPSHLDFDQLVNLIFFLIMCLSLWLPGVLLFLGHLLPGFYFLNWILETSTSWYFYTGKGQFKSI